MARRRIWSELLPARELGAPATLALLERYSLEPLIALPPGAETGAMAASLRKLGRAGVAVGIWPLLTDEQGYWPSESNVREFRSRVTAALSFAERAGARVTTVAVDLEPPLALIHQVRAGSMRERGHLFVDALRERGPGGCSAGHVRAVAQFAELAEELHRARIATLAAVLPPVVLDLSIGTTLWQDVLKTPVTALEPQTLSPTLSPALSPVLWSTLSPMAYTSMIAAQLPDALRRRAHVLVYELARSLAHSARRRGFQPGISLGLVGTGKLAHETPLPTPGALAADVASARAAGVEDLALFSLEGVLGQAEPEAWLEAFSSTRARRPDSWSERVASSALRGLGLGAWGMARLLG